jgi:hypothetical protein
MNPVFLVVGPPASGKTTACHALASRFERGMHIEVDALRAMVVSGQELPAPDWSPALVEQIRLAREAAIGTARAYAAAGFAVVIDDFWDPHGLVEYRALVEGGEVEPVLLYPSEDAARRRNAARSAAEGGPGAERAIGHSYGMLASVVERLGREGWVVLDTTEMDVAATVAAILDATGHSSAVAGAGGVGRPVGRPVVG